MFLRRKVGARRGVVESGELPAPKMGNRWMAQPVSARNSSLGGRGFKSHNQSFCRSFPEWGFGNEWKLRDANAAMPEDEYFAKLEAIMLRIARLYQRGSGS